MVIAASEAGTAKAPAPKVVRISSVKRSWSVSGVPGWNPETDVGAGLEITSEESGCDGPEVAEKAGVGAPGIAEAGVVWEDSWGNAGMQRHAQAAKEIARTGIGARIGRNFL